MTIKTIVMNIKTIVMTIKTIVMTIKTICIKNITRFHGAHMQRGYGIGGIYKSFARFAIPLFKQNAKALGEKALQAATQVGQDVLEGKMLENL